MLSTQQHPNFFQIIYSDKYKMYDFTIFNNNKVI